MSLDAILVGLILVERNEKSFVKKGLENSQKSEEP